MTVLRFMVSVLAAAAILVTVAGPAAWAQEGGEARLGGASDIAADTVVQIPQGGEIGPLHYIFVDNPEDQPIWVEFVADAPAGVVLDPEWEERMVGGGDRTENPFGIAVEPQVAAGEYEVVVQLVRSDIEAQPGRVTNIPAVQTSFTLEVTGEAGILEAEAVSAVSGQPVAGTLTAAAKTGDDSYFEVARTDGSNLEAEVAPGEYRVSFLLGDRTLDTAEVLVEADRTTEVVLEVETVSFVVAAARPTFEDDRPVVVDLTAAVNNEAEHVTTAADLEVVVLHNGAETETVTLDRLAELPIGLTEAAATYRPSDGWKQGTYRFRFELTTSDFALLAPQVPTLEVPPPRPGWDIRLLIVIAAGSILLLLLLDRIIRDSLRRIRRRRTLKGGRHQEGPSLPSDDSEPAPKGHPGLTNEPIVRWGPITQSPHTQPPGAAGHEKPETGPGGETGELRQASESPVLVPPPSPATRTNDRRPGEPGNEGAARVAHSMRLAQRLADQGALAPDWSIADAAMVYWAVTSEEVHEALTSLGMDDQEYMTAISKLLHLGLLEPSSR